MAIYCFAVLVVVFIYKFRHLRARWGSPGLAALCCLIFFAALTFWTAESTNMVWLDDVTGVPNIWVLLYYGFTTTTWAAAFALALFWRFPARLAWSRFRWIAAAYAVILTLRTVLFAFSSVPEERLRIDFLLTYAPQPTVAAFLLTYSVPGFVAMAGLAYWCFSWSRESEYTTLPWLRRGLRLYAAAAACYSVLCLEEIVVVLAKVSGSDALDPMSRLFPIPVALAYTTLLTGALVIPAVGIRLPAMRTWLSRWRAYFRLLPLHRELRAVNPSTVLVASGRHLDPHHRVRRAVIELNDWRWTLTPLYDSSVAEAAERRGREAGLSDEQLTAVVEAAQLKAAARTWQRGGQTTDAAHTGSGPGEESPRVGTGIDTELTWWLPVAHAYRKSPVVRDALTASATTAPTPAASPDRA